MSERLLGKWVEKPYVSHDMRGVSVEYRLLLNAYGGGSIDVRKQARSEDRRAPFEREWVDVEVWEVRGSRIEKVTLVETP